MRQRVLASVLAEHRRQPLGRRLVVERRRDLLRLAVGGFELPFLGHARHEVAVPRHGVIDVAEHEERLRLPGGGARGRGVAGAGVGGGCWRRRGAGDCALSLFGWWAGGLRGGWVRLWGAWGGLPAAPSCRRACVYWEAPMPLFYSDV